MNKVDLLIPKVEGVRNLCGEDLRDLSRFLYVGAASFRANQVKNLIAEKKLGQPQIERISLLESFKDELTGRLTLGRSPQSLPGQILEITRILRFMELHDLPFHLDKMENNFLEYAEHLFLRSKNPLDKLWCQITAHEDKPIPVVLLEPGTDPNALVESSFCSGPILKIHPSLIHNKPSLYFILGHEYHHYKAHHHGFRTAINFILFLSLLILIILALVFIWSKDITKRQHFFSVLSSVVIFGFTYYLAYNNFKQNELDSDRGSVRVLRAIKIDPAPSFKAYDLLASNELLGSKPNNRFYCYFNKFPPSIHNCNPHPTNEVRANNIQPLLNK